jgi:putative membrane protein
LRHDTAVVPLAKVQGFRWRQGPLQRRLRLATLHLDTAGRDIHAVALHRDADEARRVLEELTAVARTRRRTASLRG